MMLNSDQDKSFLDGQHLSFLHGLLGLPACALDKLVLEEVETMLNRAESVERDHVELCARHTKLKAENAELVRLREVAWTPWTAVRKLQRYANRAWLNSPGVTYEEAQIHARAKHPALVEAAQKDGSWRDKAQAENTYRNRLMSDAQEVVFKNRIGQNHGHWSSDGVSGQTIEEMGQRVLDAACDCDDFKEFSKLVPMHAPPIVLREIFETELNRIRSARKLSLEDGWRFMETTYPLLWAMYVVSRDSGGKYELNVESHQAGSVIHKNRASSTSADNVVGEQSSGTKDARAATNELHEDTDRIRREHPKWSWEQAWNYACAVKPDLVKQMRGGR